MASFFWPPQGSGSGGGIQSINSDTSSAQVITGSATPGITVSTTSGTTVITQQVANTSENGYLSAIDWNTFNGKQASGSYITALTGDVSVSGPGSATATLAAVNSNIGTFAVQTVNAKGLVTAATTLTGDITSSGAATTLATVNSNVGSFTNASVTVNAKGLVTAASSGTAPVMAVSVASTNGFAGTSSGGATPALTLSTSVTGILQGNGTAISAATTTGTGSTVVLATSPTLITPALGTPTALVGTNITGTGASFTAGTATNIAGGLGGSIPYQTAVNTTALLANGSAGQFLQSQGATLAPIWASTSTTTVSAKTSAYTIINTDGLITCDSSGGTFALTFPAASGNAGVIVRVMKTDSTTTAVTFTSGPSTGQLSTQNEYRSYISNGAAWLPLDWNIGKAAAWTAYTPTFVGFGTVTNAVALSKRVASGLELNIIFTAGTVNGSTASVTIGVNGSNSNVVASAILSGGTQTIAGHWGRSGATVGETNFTILTAPSAGTFGFGVSTATQGALNNQAGNVLIGNNEVVSLYAFIPVDNWGP